MKKLLEAPSDIFDINPPKPQPTQQTSSDTSTSSTQPSQ
jgi:hypothetical protein